MRILLTESDRGAADRLARDLAEAGYDGVRYQRVGDLADECVFFRGRFVAAVVVPH